MKKSLFTFLVFSLFILPSIGQKSPITFGKITREEVASTTYDLDTSAAAVVLCDFGWFDKDNFQFTRTLRYKILKKAGYDISDLRYLTGEKPAVKGMVYNMEGDQVVKEKLNSSNIFFKMLGSGLYETSIAIPNLKVGTVFDIQYTSTGIPYEWYFQKSVPVKYSEINIPRADYFKYSTNFFGYLPLTVSSLERWGIANAPAFKPEPYINSKENYISKMEINIKAITYTGNFRAISSTWEDVNAVLLQNNNFPAQKQPLPCASSIIDELKESGKQGEDLVRAAFEAVKKMSWNKEYSVVISDEGLCNHLKLGSGNIADINFTLLQVLKKLGFDVYPVVLSSRSNGVLSQFNPSLNKLDYLIIALKTESGFTLLDASEKYMPSYLLPDRAINGQGRIVDDKISQWIPLTCKYKDQSDFRYELTLNSDLNLTGKIIGTFTDYAAYDFRDDYSSYNNKDEYARAMEKINPGLIINDVTIENLEDLYKPIIVTMDVNIEGLVTQVDKELYITPMLFEQVKENPFNAVDRKYPICFSRQEDTKVNVVITLPDNVTTGILPKPMSSKLRNNAVAFTYNASNEGKQVKVDYAFNINSLMINQEMYKDVRNVYNNLVSKHAEPVILKMQ
ncbi:MAG TPA: hypothetical protein PKH02_00855 [Bacteroidales bacterium]|nr:hypothetical protein [Bacteroidales bacterium]HPT11775.1 hypothetical protein [Bacteroidales bacterium]